MTDPRDALVGSALADMTFIHDINRGATALAADLAAARAEIARLREALEPTTIPAIQAAIGRLQSKLEYAVLGDPRVGVTAALSPERQEGSDAPHKAR